MKIQESQDFSQLNEFPERIILDAAEGSKKSATIKVINETWEVINPGALGSILTNIQEIRMVVQDKR